MSGAGRTVHQPEEREDYADKKRAEEKSQEADLSFVRSFFSLVGHGGQ